METKQMVITTSESSSVGYGMLWMFSGELPVQENYVKWCVLRC